MHPQTVKRARLFVHGSRSEFCFQNKTVDKPLVGHLSLIRTNYVPQGVRERAQKGFYRDEPALLAHKRVFASPLRPSERLAAGVSVDMRMLISWRSSNCTGGLGTDSSVVPQLSWWQCKR